MSDTEIARRSHFPPLALVSGACRQKTRPIDARDLLSLISATSGAFAVPSTKMDCNCSLIRTINGSTKSALSWRMEGMLRTAERTAILRFRRSTSGPDASITSRIRAKSCTSGSNTRGSRHHL